MSSIFQHSESLIPDAPELIDEFLEKESDHTCKRNAFIALSAISHDRALAYLSKVFDGIPNANELLQLGELEFIRKDALQNSQNKVLDLPHGTWYTVESDRTHLGQIFTFDLRSTRGYNSHSRLRSGIISDSPH